MTVAPAGRFAKVNVAPEGHTKEGPEMATLAYWNGAPTPTACHALVVFITSHEFVPNKFVAANIEALRESLYVEEEIR